MAQADLDAMTGDRAEYLAGGVGADGAVTAEDNLVGFGESIVDTDARTRAEAAGVIDAAYINYDVALDAYAARPDIEDLAHKNARDFPADFADASFMRTVDGQAGTGSAR